MLRFLDPGGAPTPVFDLRPSGPIVTWPGEEMMSQRSQEPNTDAVREREGMMINDAKPTSQAGQG